MAGLKDRGNVASVAADVSDEGQVVGLVEEVVSRYGRLDFAFDNAANAEALSSSGALTDRRRVEFESIVRTLLTSAWLCTRHEIPAMLERNLAAATPEGREANVERYEQVIAMRRLGQPSEVAAAVTWLCSDAASYVTGQVLSVGAPSGCDCPGRLSAACRGG